ncbi:hypothetical protein EVB41_075 [Rhizobium phage RHph_TM3_14A]|nr:hypothetical protein EVB29_076 [Rhizobium phage RHph_TM27A]QIG66996.1 hypothetical protein EVB30_076 [Rhizobium phage RHph_TM27B]QIG67084.1 hypothetical protein EVB31_074 [Rhizobium phage RHph_TM29]QIG67540.1 hypothetical protein EVB41_075 [Rhizobium phage RHph_TM3_14A]
MSALIPANFGAISAKFANAPVTDELSAGIQSSFGLIGYKGKVWSIRYRGDDTPLMRDDGDGPRGSIEVVVVKASQHISKIWYEQGYVEGSNAAPDCFSNNGITPEPTSAKKQCDSCALCPHNAWGSRITPAGKAGKACADSKRLAVVPEGDLANELFGGPMLLRVPAASLQDLAVYGNKMQQMGYPAYAVATRISFDVNESYPKFNFNAIRPLRDDEADIILAMREGQAVQRILSENEFAPATVATPEDVSSVFEQPPETQAPAKTPSVGDQARAAAAQQAEAAKAAQADAAKKQADAAAKAKKAADAKAKKEALAKELAEAEAAAATSEVTEEESEEDRELREMEEKLAAARAKKQAAAASAAATQQPTAQQSAPTPETNVTASPSDDNPVSDFEAELDDMLNNLLPA